VWRRALAEKSGCSPDPSRAGSAKNDAIEINAIETEEKSWE
jgi:hypothetical protein